MTPTPELVEISSNPILVALRPFSRVDLPILIRSAFDQVYAFPGLGKQGHNIIVYRNGNLEAGVILVKDLDPPAGLVKSSTPSGRAVTATHWGDYSKMGETNQVILSWCKDQGVELAGT